MTRTVHTKMLTAGGPKLTRLDMLKDSAKQERRKNPRKKSKVQTKSKAKSGGLGVFERIRKALQ